jgi:hypothetical protein
MGSPRFFSDLLASDTKRHIFLGEATACVRLSAVRRFDSSNDR